LSSDLGSTLASTASFRAVDASSVISARSMLALPPLDGGAEALRIGKSTI
jgi:hypothetical protein